MQGKIRDEVVVVVVVVVDAAAAWSRKKMLAHYAEKRLANFQLYLRTY
jgi:hypothetical protein